MKSARTFVLIRISVAPERGDVVLAASVVAVEDVRDAGDLVQHAEHPRHVGHHEHRHQRHHHHRHADLVSAADNTRINTPETPVTADSPPHLPPGLGAGDLVAVDDGAVEGGHEDDRHDAGRQQRVHDLVNNSPLKSCIDLRLGMNRSYGCSCRD